MNAKAARLNIPLGVHLDVTYRCNERCVHCYLDHDDNGEMRYEEIHDLLGQMAAAGVLFLTISGGEPLLRKDLFAIIRRARELTFSVKLKTNGILIREQEAAQATRARYREGSDQHLFASRRDARRNHQSAWISGPFHWPPSAS